MHGDGKNGIPSLFIGSETIMKTNLVQIPSDAVP
jgi:hypothetical protein